MFRRGLPTPRRYTNSQLKVLDICCTCGLWNITDMNCKTYELGNLCA